MTNKLNPAKTAMMVNSMVLTDSSQLRHASSSDEGSDGSVEDTSYEEVD